jgi:hypothetical protein
MKLSYSVELLNHIRDMITVMGSDPPVKGKPYPTIEWQGTVIGQLRFSIGSTWVFVPSCDC